MADQSEIVRRVVELIRTSVPAEDLSRALVPAIICAGVGLVLLFCGARVIRTLIVIACLTGGGYGGWVVAQHFAKPPAIGILAGAVVLGLGGLLLARLFIAALSGAMAGLVVLSILGYQQDLGVRFGTFADTFRQPAPTADNEFPLGESGSSEEIAALRPYQVVLRFVDHLRQTDTATLRNLVLYVGGAGLIGAAVGFIAHRWAMIFWTSLGGLAMVAGGGGVLLNWAYPQWHEVMIRNALTVCIVTLAVWLLGMVVQWRSTRRIARSVATSAEVVAPPG